MIKTYHCPTCKRDIDYLVNIKTPDLHRCIITKGCSGILEPIASKPGSISKMPAVTALPDWIKRGTSNSFSEIFANFGFVSISSSFYNDVVIHSPDISLTSLTFNVSSLIGNKQDVYLFITNGDVSTLTGQDSSVLKNVIRINANDLVKVKVNGIETTEFEYTSSSITFVPKISGSNHIEIYVIRFDESSENQVTIEASSLNITPWSNTDMTNCYVFNLSAFTSLKGYQLATQIPNGKVLLSKPPYSGIDQIDSYYISCDDLQNYNITLRIDSNGYSVLNVPDIAVTHLTRPLEFKRDKNNMYDTINIANEIQQIQSSYIIGPT